MKRTLSTAHKDAIIEAAGERNRKLREFDRLQKIVDALLNHCPDMECGECGKIVCPHGEPLHFHHDGCPACSQERT